jgi:hypothetical protein
MAILSPENKKSRRKQGAAKVSDCLIITYPDGTDNHYNKGEECKGWKEVPNAAMPVVIVYFPDGSYMKSVGHPYRILEVGTEV